MINGLKCIWCQADMWPFAWTVGPNMLRIRSRCRVFCTHFDYLEYRGDSAPKDNDLIEYKIKQLVKEKTYHLIGNQKENTTILKEEIKSDKEILECDGVTWTPLSCYDVVIMELNYFVPLKDQNDTEVIISRLLNLKAFS
jgi:hypothetical protein